MKVQLQNLRDSLADSFWFLPAMMALLAAVIALGVVSLDHAISGQWAKETAWIWSGGPDGARSVLSTVAGSVMTVVSIVFSLTISVLSQTSSHYGPRVLRNFTSDRFVQFTLGIFIATFVYCLLVLRTVRSIEEAAFVPYLAVNLGMLFAIASLGVLIFFIHFVAQSIQAENLIADVGRDFQKTALLLFPERIGEDKEEVGKAAAEIPEPKHWKHASAIESKQNGYIQRIDDEQLMKLATRHDLQIKIEKRPGEFVSRHVALARVVPASRTDDSVRRLLEKCFVVGQHRTPHQDVLFSIQQLVEINAHALSPGINEPFTALTCIDWLGASLRSVAERDLPKPLRYDESGSLRVVATPVTFDEMTHIAFDQVRVYAANSPDVLLALLRVITEIAPSVYRDADRDSLAHHVRLIQEDMTKISNSNDRERVQQQLRSCLQALRQDQVD